MLKRASNANKIYNFLGLSPHILRSLHYQPCPLLGECFSPLKILMSYIFMAPTPYKSFCTGYTRFYQTQVLHRTMLQIIQKLPFKPELCYKLPTIQFSKVKFSTMKFLTMKFSNQNYIAKFSTIKFSKVKFLTIKFLTMKFSNQNYVAKFSTVQISTIKFSTIKFRTMKFSNQNYVTKLSTIQLSIPSGASQRASLCGCFPSVLLPSARTGFKI